MNALPGWGRDTSPFHKGELALQDLAGKRVQMEAVGHRVIRPFMPEQHRDFFAQLPFLVVGGVDGDGWPWASILTGKPGFIDTPDDRSMRVDAIPVPGDPLKAALKSGAPLGLLGIELGTRRRNRLNVRITSMQQGQLSLSVDQSYGNCPQYIQTRNLEFVREPGQMDENINPEHLCRLDEDSRRLIRSADTLFVASYLNATGGSETDGVDVSHRGGRPGFVKVEDNTLTIPDFAGNNFFNTLGNFFLNPRAGLLFPDFETGDLLMLTGTVRILHDRAELESFQGAERAWQFTLDHGVRLKDALPIRWKFKEFSPNSLATGTWNGAEPTSRTETPQNAWRPYRVVRVQDESSVIRSFYLQPEDGAALPPYKAGQHLTVRVRPAGSEQAIVRNYTLSSSPGDDNYRISVKREFGGLASNHLHDALSEGTAIEVIAPRGDFWIDPAGQRPIVLIAGGVGVTPILSMARHMALEREEDRHARPLTVIHAARTVEERAFFETFRALARTGNGTIRYLSLISRPGAEREDEAAFDSAGRIDRDILRKHLPLDDYDFFLCGPNGFMQSVYDDLSALGVRDARIHAETFGPSALKRNNDPETSASGLNKLQTPASQATVAFSKTGFERTWKPEDGSLLEFAETHGLMPDHSCRSGSCGACAVPLLSGATTYRNEVTAPVEEGEVLICSALPAEGTGSIVLDV